MQKPPKKDRATIQLRTIYFFDCSELYSKCYPDLLTFDNKRMTQNSH